MNNGKKIILLLVYQHSCTLNVSRITKGRKASLPMASATNKTVIPYETLLIALYSL